MLVFNIEVVANRFKKSLGKLSVTINILLVIALLKYILT